MVNRAGRTPWNETAESSRPFGGTRTEFNAEIDDTIHFERIDIVVPSQLRLRMETTETGRKTPS